MFVRNFLRAGDYLTIVPIGVLLTLQYDDRGLIEKVYEFHEEHHRVDVTDELLADLLGNKTIPNKIPIKNGTSWVFGVLTSNTKVFNDSGILPKCISDSFIQEFKSDPESFSFLAGAADSLATVFRGAVKVRQWLSVAHFDVLPGFPIPADNFSEDSFQDIIQKLEKSSNTIPDYPMICEYILYKSGYPSFIDLGFSQNVVKRVSKFVDDFGNIYAKLSLQDDDELVVDYCEVVRFNINTNTLILLDEENNVLYSRSTDSKKRDRRSSTIECSVCGKKIHVRYPYKTHCEDDHCNSRLYPKVLHLLDVLELPGITKSRYDEITKEFGLDFNLLDILDAKEFSDIELIVPIDVGMRSVIPYDIISKENTSFIRLFVSKCNDSITSIEYYIKNPGEIYGSLGISPSTVCDKFIDWLEDGNNFNDILDVLHNKHMTYQETNKTFDGPPIFRGKRILVTGEFLHGSSSEIESILSSYSAQVVYDYSEGADCLVIGDVKENISGKLVKEAQIRRIPIFSEFAFFNNYDIDSDIAENLKYN